MKIGFRTPSLKKSLKARTTGKLKRSIKRSINPLYGKKGTGLITDPKKAVYNKVYNKTTVGLNDITKVSKSKSNKNVTTNTISVNPSIYKVSSILLRILGALIILLSLLLIIGGLKVGIFFLLFGIFLYFMGKVYKNKSQETKIESEEDTINENI